MVLCVNYGNRCVANNLLHVPNVYDFALVLLEFCKVLEGTGVMLGSTSMKPPSSRQEPNSLNPTPKPIKPNTLNPKP